MSDIDEILSQYGGSKPELRAGPGPQRSYLDDISNLFRNKLQGSSYFDDAASAVSKLLSKPSTAERLNTGTKRAFAEQYKDPISAIAAGQSRGAVGDVWPESGFTPAPNIAQRVLGAIPENVGFATNFLGPQAAIFAGPGARTANLAAMATAQKMAASGAPREAIWNETGWFQGPEKKWRWEIDDSGALYKHAEPGPGDGPILSLPRHMKHDALYEAYPDAKNVTVAGTQNPFYEGGWIGRFGKDPLDAIMEINSSNPNKRNVALHEIQHGVQYEEGFAGGASPDLLRLSNKLPETPEWQAWKASQEHPLRKQYEALKATREYGDEIRLLDQIFRDEYQPRHKALDSQWIARDDAEGMARLQRERMALNEEYNQKVRQSGMFPVTERAKDLGRQMYELGLTKPRPSEQFIKPFEAYKRSAGEVEARAVQARENLTPQQRKDRAPWLDYDVPESQMIIP